MESSDYSVLEYNIDKSQVPPIEQKRIVAFINHFVVSTVTFLNKFAVNCETKFIDFESKLQKVEASLTILEAKLSTIPGINQISTPDSTSLQENVQLTENIASATIVSETRSSDTVDKNNIDNQTTVSSSPKSNNSTLADNSVENVESSSTTATTDVNANPGVRVCDDQRYKKYFKMMQFGVPAPAVKLKMEAEGIDSGLLEEPNKILEDGIITPPTEE